MPIVSAKGLFETHLAVSNLDRSMRFYSEIVGLTVANRIPERHVVFFWIGSPGQAMLGLWSLHSSPLRMQLHLALTATVEELLTAPACLRAAGLTPLDGLGRPAGEPDVIGWMPAVNVYFRDPDEHMLELIAMIDEPPNLELGFIPLSKWRALPDTIL